jgi:DNA-directed RNA polymerase specialized sigma24 family protein
LLIDCMPRLRAFVRRLVGDRETEEELLQEISLRALAGEGPGDEEFFLAWSCGIARHVIGIEWRRRRRARAELPIEDEGLADELCDPMAFPDTCVAARESLLHAMNDLDPDGLDLLIRRYILGKAGKDLAEEIDAIAYHAQGAARRFRKPLRSQRSAPQDPGPARVNFAFLRYVRAALDTYYAGGA